jgi:hypothetical protein
MSFIVSDVAAFWNIQRRLPDVKAGIPQQWWKGLLVLSAAVFGMIHLTSCTIDPFNPVQPIPSAEYRGTFSLTLPDTSDAAGFRELFVERDVTLVLNDANRTYNVVPTRDSSVVVSSEGLYALTFRTITLRDKSARPASDASRIMQGDFVYTFDGQNLILSQESIGPKRKRVLTLLRRF